MNGIFQSVAANFLFHCLRGSNLYDKRNAFRNCASLLDPRDGVFFGSTILGKEMLDDDQDNTTATTTTTTTAVGGGGEMTTTAMRILRDFNNVGVFDNLGDSFQDLQDILRTIFEDVEVQRVGYCGVWTARHPKIENDMMGRMADE